VRQDGGDVAVLGPVIDATHKPVAVPANVEDVLVAEDISRAKRLFQIVEALIITRLHQFSPYLERSGGVDMKLATALVMRGLAK
jgi:hypothetical protein